LNYITCNENIALIYLQMKLLEEGPKNYNMT